VRFATQSLAPAGLFSDELEAMAVFTGHVVESALRTNSLTGREYAWAAVESLGGAYDVVAARELLSAAPPAGAVVMGSFWLSGRLLDEPRHVEHDAEPEEAPAPPKGLLRRLFG
jgi:hypothetical protein